MRYAWLPPAVACAALLATACGGGGKSSTPAQQTFDAQIDQARQTPVDDTTREYAQQLCGPLRELLDNAGETLASFETPATDDLDFDVLFETLAQLRDPLSDFVEAMRDIDPPGELQAYHDAFIIEMEYGIDSIDALSEGGLAGAFALPSPPPEAVPPDDLDAAVGQECGPELRDLVDEFGGDFFGSNGDGDATPAPVTGGLDEDLESENYTVRVNDVQDPYPAGELYELPPGKRWVVVGVSITNTSEQEQQIFTFDFSLLDVAGEEYAASFAGAPQELESGSLAVGDSVSGNIAFEVADDAEIAQLVYTAGFFGEDTFEVDLR